MTDHRFKQRAQQEKTQWLGAALEIRWLNWCKICAVWSRNIGVHKILLFFSLFNYQICNCETCHVENRSQIVLLPQGSRGSIHGHTTVNWLWCNHFCTSHARALYGNNFFTILGLELLQDFLKPGMKALDVGSGSGYLVACMAQMVCTEKQGQVYGIEYIPQVFEQSIKNLQSDVEVKHLLNEQVFVKGNGYVFC